MNCQFCGSEFVPYHKTQKFCCRRCREKAEYRASVEDGRQAAKNARKRAARAAKRAMQPKCVSRKSNTGLSAARCHEIEREMELPRDELMRASSKWTQREHRYAQKVWEKKHGLFRTYPERG